MSDMKENGVLASVTIAQAILESSWGTSELAEKANKLLWYEMLFEQQLMGKCMG